jgi:chloramphenicol-sensitive protein RarD
MFYWATHEAHAFPHAGTQLNALLMFGGPLTALPLALFAEGVRRIRLSTLGFLQFLNPIITLLLATLGFGEHFTKTDLVGFGLVWVALVIVTVDGALNRAKPAVSNPEPA